MGPAFERVWRQLNQPALDSVPPRLAEDDTATFSSALGYFTEHATTRIINLRALSADDRSYLSGKGILTEHLRRNLAKSIDGKFRDAREFQLHAVRTKSVFAFCPFTGQHVSSNRSLLANINVLFYRFKTREIFYVVTAGIGSGFQKCALYFPEHELVVTVGDEWSFDEADLFELKARVVSNSLLCHEYLADHGPEKRTAVCLGFYHFAHHLWNELSGIRRLYRRGLLSEVDTFLVNREPLGKLEDLYPEIPEGKVVRKPSIGDLFVEILAKHYFAIRVGDDYIARDLTARVHKVSIANASTDLPVKIREFAQKHAPLLWIGIRVGNRSWADQVGGLVPLIRCLHGFFPTLGVVFDGFSLPADRLFESSEGREFAEIVSQETDVVNSIVQCFSGSGDAPGFCDIIGSSIFDANLWAHAIDVYLSPYGTLQHKVGWLTNKPGVIHSNQTVLADPAKYVWAAVEGAIEPWYVSRGSVSDIDCNEAGPGLAYNGISDARECGAGIQATNKRVFSQPQFNNYHVEWTDLREQLLGILRSRNEGFTISKNRLVSAAKRKLRNTAYRLTRSIDLSGI